MLRTWLRTVQCTERLHRASGGWALRGLWTVHHYALKTVPRGRWAPLEQKAALSALGDPGSAWRSVWTQGAGACRAEEDGSKQVSVPRGHPGAAATSTAQKVKEAGRDITYLIVVLVGISVTGGLFYVIFKELFSSSSPNQIYGKALDMCRSHPEVVAVFGEPVKGFGEVTRRGRRQHVSFLEYMKDGLKHMRIKFYIQGSEPDKQGTVHLEVKENPESGQYEFRYVFVEVDSYPGRVIIVEDNRS